MQNKNIVEFAENDLQRFRSVMAITNVPRSAM